MVESFFNLLKRERICRKVYRTRDEARRDVFDYIEMLYNPTRQHAWNGMLAPIEFERKHKAKAEGVQKTRGGSFGTFCGFRPKPYWYYQIQIDTIHARYRQYRSPSRGSAPIL